MEFSIPDEAWPLTNLYLHVPVKDRQCQLRITKIPEDIPDLEDKVKAMFPDAEKILLRYRSNFGDNFHW